MDKRINAAALAFPKLEPVIRNFFEQSSPAELHCSEEELFYETSSGDIYVALTFEAWLDGTVSHKILVVRVPNDGPLAILDVATLLEKSLEDLTHIIPRAVIQVLRNQYTSIQLRTALQTSVVLMDTCEIQSDRSLIEPHHQ